MEMWQIGVKKLVQYESISTILVPQFEVFLAILGSSCNGATVAQ